MKMSLLGLAMCAVGIIVGLYVGGWLLFIGGLTDVVEQVRAAQMDKSIFAVGVLKVMFAGFVGYISAAILFIPGVVFLGKGRL